MIPVEIINGGRTFCESGQCRELVNPITNTSGIVGLLMVLGVGSLFIIIPLILYMRSRDGKSFNFSA